MTTEERLAAALADNAELKKHLLRIMDGSWTYVHGWCTIDSVKEHWRQAREYLGTYRPL